MENFEAKHNRSTGEAIARAIVGYDPRNGPLARSLVSESAVLADRPRGSRKFYWDTVFIPEDPDGRAKGKTYAEIVDDTNLGLDYKLKLSQSTIAMLEFLEYRLKNAPALLEQAPVANRYSTHFRRLVQVGLSGGFPRVDDLNALALRNL